MINKTHKTTRIISLLVLSLLFLPLVCAASIPTFMIVSGTATIYKTQAAPGTVIKAYIVGDSDPLKEDGTTTVATPGQYSMVITGDLLLDNGRTVIFKVNDTQVDEFTIFVPMAIIELNLSVDCEDNDNDGYSPNGMGCGLIDCNDGNGNINPGAADVCNGIDDDCDTQIDEDLTQSCGSGSCAGTQTCSAGTWGDCSTRNSDCGTCCKCEDNDNPLPAYDATQDSDCPSTECPDSCALSPDDNPYTWDYAYDVPNECASIGQCTLNECNYAHECSEDCGAECVIDNDCPEKCTATSHKLYNFIGCDECECVYGSSASATCVVGKCGAECDEDTDCSCAQDSCDGTTLADYPEYGRCGSAGEEGCLCQVGTGLGGDCEPQQISCDDNNACTADACDPVTGCSHTPISCNDGNVCTDDSCDSILGCQYTYNTAPCDDNLFCTVNDMCAGGVCSGEANPCSDGVGCTDDSCNEDTDSCDNIPNDALCPSDTVCADYYCSATLDCQVDYEPTTTLCNTNYLCSGSPGGDNLYNAADYTIPSQGYCDGSGNCDYSSDAPVCDLAEGTAIEGQSICIDAQSSCVDTCTDTIDNDADGCTDAVDSDCGGTDTTCDGLDNDCDGEVDNGFPDYDNDKTGCNYNDDPLYCGADCVDEDDDNDSHPDDEDAYPFDPDRWILGDVNGDDAVNILDLILTRRQFGKTPADPDWNSYYDMNNDGKINILDLILIRRNFT